MKNKHSHQKTVINYTISNKQVYFPIMTFDLQYNKSAIYKNTTC